MNFIFVVTALSETTKKLFSRCQSTPTAPVAFGFCTPNVSKYSVPPVPPAARVPSPLASVVVAIQDLIQRSLASTKEELTREQQARKQLEAQSERCG